ncbi:hypothetical protein NC651_014151 [Populus alba x Populus x berolinensis]|nr:hypothetical protein NC651_014151 [Populus alba x Populus x berolinensis]
MLWVPFALLKRLKVVVRYGLMAWGLKLSSLLIANL